MDFHKKYKKTSSWWKFIRQEFQLLEDHSEYTGIFDYEYEDDLVKITKDSIITSKKTFQWGASFLTVDTPSTRRASCIHDAFFHLSDKGVFKGENSKNIMYTSNELLYKMCLEDGMYKWRAKMWKEALDAGSSLAWESSN